MALVQKTAPTIEPVTAAEVKTYLRLDSVSVADNIEAEQSIPPGAHGAIAAYGCVGTGIDVLGYDVLAVFTAATVGTNASVTVKLQDSEDNTNFADVTGGGFTRVTTSTDNDTFEKAYTGGKQYVRGVATVATASCDFAVTILKESPETDEDDFLDMLITTAREMVEEYLGRSLQTQTWYYYLNSWPDVDSFRLPLPPVATITAVTYKGTDGTAATFSTSSYIKDTDSRKARVVLAYGASWPSDALYPSNPIRTEYITGYGASRSDVPAAIRRALLALIAYLYENRDDSEKGIPDGIKRALFPWRVFPS